MSAHHQAQQETSRYPQWDTTPPPPDPKIYRVYFPIAAGLVGFPVEGCVRQKTTRTNLWINFLYRPLWETIVIMEEGNHIQP